MSEVEARDAGSVTGRNIINIRQEFGKDPRLMTSKELRSRYSGTDVPEGDGWKLDLLSEMLKERQERNEDGKEGEDIKLLQFFIDACLGRVSTITDGFYSATSLCNLL